MIKVQNLSDSPQNHSQNSNSYVKVEEFDEDRDQEFIKEAAEPYFRDVFKDLSQRRIITSPQKSQNTPESQNVTNFIDRHTFFDYTQLPGIICDRFYKMMLKKDQTIEGVTEKSFVDVMITTFMSDLEKKMKLTFSMYDFDEDDRITKEDIRTILSYIPFERNKPLNVSPFYKQKETSIQNNKQQLNDFSQMASRFQQNEDDQQEMREGNYREEEGKHLKFEDRIQDQKEILQFLSKIFPEGKTKMTFEEYKSINIRQSSELFFSIMSILHNKLPCSQNFFLIKRAYRQKNKKGSVNSSPCRLVASPKTLIPFTTPKNYKQKFLNEAFNNNLMSKGSSMRDVYKGKNYSQKSSFFTLKQNQNQDKNIDLEDEDENEEEKNIHLPLVDHLEKPDSFYKQFNQQQVKENLQLKFQDKEMSPANVVGLKNAKKAMKIPPTQNHFFNKRPQNITIDQNQKVLFKEENKNGLTPIRNENFTPQLKENNHFSPMKAREANNQKEEEEFLPQISFNSITLQQKQNSPLKYTSKKSSMGKDIQKLIAKEESEHNSQQELIPKFHLNNQELNEIDIDDNEDPMESFGHQNEQMTNNNQLQGEAYLKTKSNSLKMHYLILVGNELYIYSNKNDSQHKVMHCLTGTFIRENGLNEENKPKGKSNSPSDKMFPVRIIIPPLKTRILYFQTEALQQKWISALKLAIGYNNIYEFYNFDQTLGKGQFGLVKLAIHKKTGKKVAVKIIKKKDLKAMEIYQQRREIEILKMCQHPNIVQLIDIFENADFYYLVLEYMQGQDLFDYLQKRKFQISEERAKQIALQVAKAIRYLHSYGIVHRDVKLENIMMSDSSDDAIPKLVDFGLAKIIGPSETAKEPFGTLGYVAPEVLKKEPYSFSCDMWSIGCIIYALLSGCLPFDHDDQKETIRMTLHSELLFDTACWKHVSREAKMLITGLLEKKPEIRYNLEDLFSNKWFKNVKNVSLN